MVQQYSTQAILETERFSFWADAVSQTYCAANCKPLSQTGFEGAIDLHHFGPLAVSHVRSAPIEYQRGEHDLHRDAPDVFYVALSQCEDAYVMQADRESRQRYGDLVLFDSTRPYSCGYPAGDNQIICAVPRDLMLQYLPHANDLSAITLSATSSMAKLAAGMIRETAGLPDDADPAISARLGMTLLDILALTFESGLDSVPHKLNSRQRELLKKIKNYCSANIADPDLNVEQVATAHHISSRTLNRLFATEGTTAIRWLWQARLMTGYRLLTEKKTDQVSVAALDAGFINFSHFTHAFKKNFGITPHALVKKGALN